MKSIQKKNRITHTQDEFFKILVESIPTIRGRHSRYFKKTSQKSLGKVKSLIKKIPKTAKNLTLIAVPTRHYG